MGCEDTRCGVGTNGVEFHAHTVVHPVSGTEFLGTPELPVLVFRDTILFPPDDLQMVVATSPDQVDATAEDLIQKREANDDGIILFP